MTVLHIVIWNIGLREAAINLLGESHYDIALLQDAHLPPNSWERRSYSRGRHPADKISARRQSVGLPEQSLIITDTMDRRARYPPTLGANPE